MLKSFPLLRWMLSALDASLCSVHDESDFSALIVRAQATRELMGWLANKTKKHPERCFFACCLAETEAAKQQSNQI